MKPVVPIRNGLLQKTVLQGTAIIVRKVLETWEENRAKELWPVAVASGCGQWLWPVAVASGCGQWLWPVAVARSSTYGQYKTEYLI